jgi:hypothetical protein
MTTRSVASTGNGASKAAIRLDNAALRDEMDLRLHRRLSCGASARHLRQPSFRGRQSPTVADRRIDDPVARTAIGVPGLSGEKRPRSHVAIKRSRLSEKDAPQAAA